MSRFFPALFFALVFTMALIIRAPHPDPWHDFRPFWGERPGADSESRYTKANGNQLSLHLLRGAEDWVQEQRSRFHCRLVEAGEIDRQLLTELGRSDESCTIWRSPWRYDLEQTHYQAVQPTFICLENGDCLFYLYDWYNHLSVDAIPPPCKELKRTPAP